METLLRIYIALVFCCHCLPGTSQKSISGVINRYAKVTSINGLDNIDVDNSEGYFAGDTVMMVQMKGVTIDPNTNAVIGMNYTGRYEFIIIRQVSGNKITFRSNLINQYDLHSLQLVRVPSFGFANVTDEITCTPWDGNKGGIVAIIARDTLELNADIDVSSKGFAGGEKTYGNSICYPTAVKINYSNSASDSAALKGEGFVETTASYKRGRGAFGNAGGGGNGFGAGGGGGGGYGVGGKGGQASSLYCSGNYDFGGNGGEAPKDYFAGTTQDQKNRIFMGGGGGSSRGLAIGDVSGGGNGGGIIFIIASKIKNHGYFIRANGTSVFNDATNNAGGGGGGAGGTVLIAAEKISTLVNIQAKGGRGGSSGSYCSGQGGGGGGGFFWYSGKTFPSGELSIMGGQPGITSMSPCSSSDLPGFSGGDGDSANYLNPVLNGFLFNNIGKSQDICYNSVPQCITGSQPRGGNGSYKFQWQNRNKTTNHLWKTISGANQQNYSPSFLTDTTDIRRIVKSFNPMAGDTITDTCKWITINVIPEIKNTEIYPADTSVCHGNLPVVLRGNAASGGDVNYPFSYLWEESDDNTNWSSATATNTSKTYSANTDQGSKYFRRRVTNNQCTSTSNTAHVLVYPAISNNQLKSSQIICNGSFSDSIYGSHPAGGSNSFRFEWLKSLSDTLHWETMPKDTSTDYFPGALTGTVFYRRVIYSGLSNTCTDTSNTIIISVLPSIRNNLIRQNQSICEGSAPVRFTGDQPAGGDGTFHYRWDTSDDNANWEPIALSDSVNFTSVPLTASKYFRRIVFSGLNNCCSDTGQTTIHITVEPGIQNNAISENQEICSGQVPDSIRQTTGAPGGGNGLYTFVWQQRAVDETNWNSCQGENNSEGYLPTGLSKTTFFRRKIISGICTLLSDSVRINVLPSISGNTITGNAEVCDRTIPATLTGASVSGGEQNNYRYTWQDSIANSAWKEIPDAISRDYSPDLLSQTTFFRRIVKSGLKDCCISSTPPFGIQVNPLPSVLLQNMDTSVCNGSNVPLKITVVSGTPPFNTEIAENNIQIQVTGLENGVNILTFKPESSGTYQIFSVTDSKGCVALDKAGAANIRLVTVPVADAGISDQVCGLSYILKAVPGIGSGKWISSNGTTYSSDTDPHSVVTVPSYGEYMLQWREINEFCADTSSIFITFYKKPESADAGEDQKFPFKFTADLRAVTPEVGYGVWSVPNKNIQIADTLNPSTEVTGLSFGKNVFTWTVSNGVCPVAKDTVVVQVDDLIRVTGFSPNNDGKNDLFFIDGLENSKKRELKIVNRWGGEVYASDNYQNDWNGTNKNGEPLPDDTYFYILQVDGNRIYKGFIVIKR